METVGEKIKRLAAEIKKESVFFQGFIAEQILIEVCKIPEDKRPVSIKIENELTHEVFNRYNAAEIERMYELIRQYEGSVQNAKQ